MGVGVHVAVAPAKCVEGNGSGLSAWPRLSRVLPFIVPMTMIVDIVWSLPCGWMLFLLL